MTVAVYVSNKSEAACLIPWGVRFAKADHTDLLIITSKRSKGKVSWEDISISHASENALHNAVFEAVRGLNQDDTVLKQDITAGLASSDMDRTAIEFKEFSAPTPDVQIADAIDKLNVSCLLLPGDETSKASKRENLFATMPLFGHLACDTCLIRGPAPPSDAPIRILLATHGHTDIEVELNRSRQLVQTFEGSVTVLYVRPDDDMVADAVAHRNVDQLVRQVRGPYDVFEKKVRLADSLLEGIQQEDLTEYDLVVVGSRRTKSLQHVFRGLAQKADDDSVVALATMREAIPLASRMWTWFQTTCRSRIPQLDREQRIELVDRLETNSTFDFDFVALISLSTIIAALGLIRNSAAVVIGAMLVAPLMTPLVGMGFALIQANEKLIWSTMRSVLFGFAVAFMTSVILGAAIPKSWWNDVTVAAPVVESEVMLNAELASRCKPHLLDLVVALVSGVAGAYATGRPNLIGALPGVAIAAALVPPIATSGILFAIGEFELSRNAFLLFFTNIVAIVLGTTFAFWGIGINAPATKPKDGEGRQPPVLPRYIFFMLVILAFALAIWFAIDELPDVTHSFFGNVD